MLFSTSTPTHTCLSLSPFSTSNLEIPSTNYTHIMSVVTALPQTSPTAEVRLISTELQVQELYKLYVEPTRGCRKLTMEDEYMVSPKFPFNFKLPLFLSICEVTCDSYIEEELERLPISSGLARYLKPFILESVLGLAQRSPAEFKLVFDVKVVKIDLVSYQECESYRRRGLV